VKRIAGVIVREHYYYPWRWSSFQLTITMRHTYLRLYVFILTGREMEC